MELNWSTFVLEVVNFLVLVWILWRFLYTPVMDLITRRKTEIENSLLEAKNLHTNAVELQEKYSNRLKSWNQERQRAFEDLKRKIENERIQKMSALKNALAQEREKAESAAASQKVYEQRKLEEAAMIQGARFSTRLLKLASVPELEERLIHLVIEEIRHLTPERKTELQHSFGMKSKVIEVQSAFPVLPSLREKLEQSLQPINRSNRPLQFSLDDSLIAGVRITIGSWVLATNLKDELRGFVELAHIQEWIEYDNAFDRSTS